MNLYAGIDFHSNNSYLAVIDVRTKDFTRNDVPTGQMPFRGKLHYSRSSFQVSSWNRQPNLCNEKFYSFPWTGKSIH